MPHVNFATEKAIVEYIPEQATIDRIKKVVCRGAGYKVLEVAEGEDIRERGKREKEALFNIKK